MRARVLAFGGIGLTLVALVLFGVAGRVDWPAAWILLAMFAAFFAYAAATMPQRDPDLLRERLKAGGRPARGDNAIMAVYRLLLLALFATAALDAGRYRWSLMPPILQIAGAVLILIGFVMVWWCMTANRFLSAVVRVQADRGHRVVQNGPYRFVRHPMYAGLIGLIAGMALLLGSWLALIPAALAAAMLVVRIALEERVLLDGLDGYREYTVRVRNRLLPGVW
jgi:protein-S-isoprenylcysteine O-methyltransferase Ste14